MLVTPKHTDVIPHIYINGLPIEFVNEYKYLGLTVDKNLKFDKHCKNLTCRLSKLTGITFSLGPLLSLGAARCFYFSMAQSIISYMIVIWGGAPACFIDRVQIAQNKIIINLFSSKFPLLSTVELFSSLNILKVRELYKLEIGKLVYSALFLGKYMKMHSLLTDLNWDHAWNTRHADPIRLPRVRLDVDRLID